MLISDLSYCENVSASKLIFGGALLGLTATASTDGGTTLTTTNIDLKSNSQVTKAKGTGTALAIGTDPLADVDTYYEGFDKVKIKFSSATGENYAYETLKIKAMDLPH